MIEDRLRLVVGGVSGQDPFSIPGSRQESLVAHSAGLVLGGRTGRDPDVAGGEVHSECLRHGGGGGGQSIGGGQTVVNVHGPHRTVDAPAQPEESGGVGSSGEGDDQVAGG
jgi:hypothetical protein